MMNALDTVLETLPGLIALASSALVLWVVL